MPSPCLPADTSRRSRLRVACAPSRSPAPECLDEARTLALETVERLAPTDAIDERGEVSAATAEVFALSGDQEAADRWAADAIALFTEKGNLVSAARVAADSKNWGKPG